MIQLIRMNFLNIMKKPKRKYERDPEPYEGMIIAENLDAYESLIKFNLVNKKIINLLNSMNLFLMKNFKLFLLVLKS